VRVEVIPSRPLRLLKRQILGVQAPTVLTLPRRRRAVEALVPVVLQLTPDPD
jgi:hypothetical protein